jgi:hypothetical protein
MNRFRLLEEKRRFEEGERQELNAKLAPVLAERAATLAANTREMRGYWSRPITVIGENVRDNIFISDMGVAFETTEKPVPSAGRNECLEFLERLTARTGYCLNSVGQHRLLMYGVSQCLAQCADLSRESTWEKSFSRLVELDAFGDELGFDENLRTEFEPAPQEPEPTAADLESIDTSSRAGQRIAEDILSRAIFQGEAKQVFREWLDSLKNNFDYEMPPEVQREVVQWFLANRRSWLDRKAYDDCRLNLIRRSVIPASCLTEVDRLNWEIEDEYDTTTYEGRRRLAHAAAEINRR